jgi:hypothetical protein
MLIEELKEINLKQKLKCKSEKFCFKKFTFMMDTIKYVDSQ